MNLPMLARVGAIAVVAIVILLPIRLISAKVAERQARAQAVVAQFARETSGPQLVVGPLLALQCEEAATDGGATSCGTAYVAPRTLKATARMPVETRSRGIYPIRSFRAEVELSGEFDWPEPPAADGARKRAWKQVSIGVYVEDPRGIKSVTSSLAAKIVSGTGTGSVAQFPVLQQLGAHESRKAGAVVPFDYKMSLVGTSSLRIAPVAERNEVTIASDWPHPSFSEAFSPD